MKKQAIKLGVEFAENEMSNGGTDKQIQDAFIEAFESILSNQSVDRSDAHAWLLEHSERYSKRCQNNVNNGFVRRR
jgi:hypothetical protein